MNPLLKLALEVGPLAVFFLSFGQWGIFVATAAFMLAVLASAGVSWRLTGKIPKMTLVTAIIVIVFGGMTLILHDETFIKLKPTILYALFALALGLGLVRGEFYLRTIMEEGILLTETGWRQFTLRWIGFFVAMALLNEAVWRTQSTEQWVAVKTFVYLPLTFLFMGFQIPLIRRSKLVEKDGE